MSKEKLKAKKGITLIALVVTIIVMLILVAATVTVALNGGLFSSAKKATADTEAAREAESELSNGQVNIDNTIYNSIEEYVGATSGGGYKTAAELFDASKETLTAITGKEDEEFTTDGKLHIGDFINYKAGTWTEAEIKAIKTGKKGAEVEANGKNDELPNESYQFGGFAVGDSRDGDAIPNSDWYTYAKFSNEEAITGWRVFDVAGDSITLISAGCPEDFYVPNENVDNGNGGYISEYILLGNENSSASELNLGANYTKRNWDNYVNGNQHATKANALTKGDLDKWYKKYMEMHGFDSFRLTEKFQKIYTTRYENLIDNYSFFWLPPAYESDSIYSVWPDDRAVIPSCVDANGIRVLVALSSDIQLSKSGEKTVVPVDDGEEGRSLDSYTYNVWDIK